MIYATYVVVDTAIKYDSGVYKGPIPGILAAGRAYLAVAGLPGLEAVML